MFNQKQILGGYGESIAREYYLKNHFRILAQNWRCAAGELDLVCEKAGVLHAVEVKTRRTLRYGFPEEAVTLAKKRRILRCAQAFLKFKPRRRTYRIIVVQVFAIYVTVSRVMVKIYTDV